MNYCCLIVDDEEMIAQTTCEYFNMFDVPSYYVTSYEACIDFFKENQALLLLLDINLGDKSGFELCKNLRQSLDIPILFISARTSDDDILTALNIGGDDYITKPYSLNIVLAKIKAILRRCEGVSTPPLSPTDSSMNLPIQLDDNYHQAIVNGSPVRLKEMEYKLLRYFLSHPGKVLTKEELFQEVWKESFVGEGTLSVHIRHLRLKIETDPNHPQYIKTLWGVGYVFEVPDYE